MANVYAPIQQRKWKVTNEQPPQKLNKIFRYQSIIRTEDGQVVSEISVMGLPADSGIAQYIVDLHNNNLDTTNERNAMISLIKEMGNIIKALDPEEKHIGFHNDEGMVPYLSDIFVLHSKPE